VTERPQIEDLPLIVVRRGAGGEDQQSYRGQRGPPPNELLAFVSLPSELLSVIDEP
jgi:hypothetical protein